MHNGIYIKVTIKKQRKIEKINTYARWFLCKFCNFPTNRAKSSETVEKKKEFNIYILWKMRKFTIMILENFIYKLQVLIYIYYDITWFFQDYVMWKKNYNS